MSGQLVDETLMSINSICSLLEFSGDGSCNFLNNLLISDLASLPKKQFHYTAICNPKGRIISSLWVNIMDSEKIILVCPSNMHSYLLNFFNMRKFRLKIAIQPSDKCIVINLQEKCIQLQSDRPKQANLDDYYLFCFNQNLPWIDYEYTEKHIPQQVNLDQHKHIMSFNKGCYPGQEIIARLKYLGKNKKQMHLLTNKSKTTLVSQIEKAEVVSPIAFSKKQNSYVVQVSKSSAK